MHIVGTKQYTEIEERDARFYDEIKGLYEKIHQFKGVRKIVGDWSLTKIENVNFEMIKPYLRGKKILEVGCGRGCLTAMVSQVSPIVAFDISKGSLNYARELGNLDGDVFYFQGNIYSIPFESGAFDIVIATEILEHLPKLDKAMSEINRVLRIGGKVIASVPNTLMYFYPVVLLAHLARQSGRSHLFGLVKRQTDDSPDMYSRPFLPSQFRDLFEGSGFSVVKHRTSMFYFWRFPYEQIILYGDRICPSLTGHFVRLIIKLTDLILDREFPVLKWLGARQHILAEKANDK